VVRLPGSCRCGRLRQHCDSVQWRSRCGHPGAEHEQLPHPCRTTGKLGPV